MTVVARSVWIFIDIYMNEYIYICISDLQAYQMESVIVQIMTTIVKVLFANLH